MINRYFIEKITENFSFDFTADQRSAIAKIVDFLYSRTNNQVFLLKGYSQREYGEPFHVLQKDGSQWFGIDCYRTKRPVNLCLGVIDAVGQRL